jgi:ribosome-associated toxin RatA of RatAB toxin-antitoxin module
VCAKQKGLAVAQVHIGLSNLRFARPHGFDFPALKHEASLITLFYKVIEARATILGDQARGLVLVFGHGQFYGAPGARFYNVAMREVSRTALIAQPAARVYALINDIERYPEFLPWCTQARIESRRDNEIVATLAIQRGPLTTEFTTRNRLTPDTRIDLQLERGPFDALSGYWLLTPLADKGCRVQLSMRFAFSNRVSALLLEPLFEKTLEALVDAFVLRARS